MMPGQAARCASAAFGLFAALAACDRQSVSAAGLPYEIVTQTRPESLHAYLRVYRTAYDACALARVAQKLPPPPPFVTLPADFVLKRSTYLSSGHGYLIRHEEFGVVIDDTDCKTRIGSHMQETVVRGEKVTGQRRELDGHVEIDEEASVSPHAADGSSFTDKRTVGGIAMRCAPAGWRTDTIMETCVADAGAGALLDGLRYPIVLHARSVVPVHNMVVLTEPVSVQIGKPVPPERITLSRAK